MIDLDRLAENVHDAKQFANFVGQMARHFVDDKESWENITIYAYLEALAAWLDDTDRFYRLHDKTLPEQPSWHFCAEMLLAAKVYE